MQLVVMQLRPCYGGRNSIEIDEYNKLYRTKYCFPSDKASLVVVNLLVVVGLKSIGHCRMH